MHPGPDDESPPIVVDVDVDDDPMPMPPENDEIKHQGPKPTLEKPK